MVGVLSSLGLAIIGLPFWLLIGMTAGVLNIIPFVGPWVGGVLAVLMALLTGDVGDAVLAALVMLGVQQLDNHIITPSVMRATVKLHPGLMVLALLIGGAQGGSGRGAARHPRCCDAEDPHRSLLAHEGARGDLGRGGRGPTPRTPTGAPREASRPLPRGSPHQSTGSGLQQTLPLDGYDEATTEELPTVRRRSIDGLHSVGSPPIPLPAAPQRVPSRLRGDGTGGEVGSAAD